MRAGSALLDPADVQGGRPEVDLILAQTNPSPNRLLPASREDTEGRLQSRLIRRSQ
jgi:hypothetical protein